MVCRFCVVIVKPMVGGRTSVVRLKDVLGRVELDNDSPRGDILAFVQYDDKLWTLCVDCVSLEQVR